VETLLAWLTILGFITAMPQIWGSSWLDLFRSLFFGTVRWETIHKAAHIVTTQIKEQGFRPSFVFGVGRGGIIAAGLVCSEMVKSTLRRSTDKPETPTLPNIKLAIINTTVVFKAVEHEADRGGTRGGSRIDKIDVLPIDIAPGSEDRILLIVAQNFTGATLEKSVAMLIKKGIQRGNIRTAALFWQKAKRLDPNHVSDTHEPDYYGPIIPLRMTMPWKSKKDSTDRF
jgi:hypoxanthine phosphoribosyltransferase